jgi:hypothetical protein
VASEEETSTLAFLHSHGIRLPARELDPMIEEAIARLQTTLYRSDPDRDLTAAEAETLREGGFRPSPRALGTDDPFVRSIAEFAALLKTSDTVDEAAARLGVEVSSIRERLTGEPPALYGVRLESGWRLPQFQFDGDRLLPGFEQVLAVLDPELHPVAVHRWITTPDPDLAAGGEDSPLSPRDWLRFELPADEVVRIARHV